MFTLAEWGSVSDIASAGSAVAAFLFGLWAYRSAGKSEAAAIRAQEKLAEAVNKLASLEASKQDCRFEIDHIELKPYPIGRELRVTVVNHSGFAITLGYAAIEGDGEVKIHSIDTALPCFQHLPIVVGPRQSVQIPFAIPSVIPLGRITNVLLRTQTGEECSFPVLTNAEAH